ncbi:MAG: hypothetical protein JSV25_14770, partial [Spirochaetota bacterium]
MKLNKAFPFTILIIVFLLLFPLKLFAVTPNITTITTRDTDANGHIDILQVDFNVAVPVDINDFYDATDGLDCFILTGYTMENDVNYDATNVTSLNLEIVEDAAFDTGVTTMTLTYERDGDSTILETDPPNDEVLDGDSVATTDGAGPI